MDDGSIADGIPLERVFVDVETDHTGVVDAGDARAHAAARDAQSGLANLAQAAQFPTAAAARAFLGAQMDPVPAPPPPLMHYFVPDFAPASISNHRTQNLSSQFPLLLRN